MFEGIPVEAGVLATTAALVLCVSILIRVKAAKIALGAMIFFAAIGQIIALQGYWSGGWLLHLQMNRSDLFVATGAVLFVAMLGLGRQISLKRTGMQVWFLLAIAFYGGLLRMVHESPWSGTVSLLFTLLTVVPLMFIIPALLREREDWYGLIRLIMWVNIAYLAGCAVQVVLDPSKLYFSAHGRFYGLSTTPIQAAVFLAVSAIVALWLILHDTKWRYRWLWIALFGINVILATATGSRTGPALLVVGATFVLYRRWGRAVVFLPIGAFVAWIAFEMILRLDLDFGFERSFETADTRTGAWLLLLEDGLANPMIGIGTGAHTETGTIRSENSYLYGFASFGFGMLLLTLALLFASIAHCMRLLAVSFRLRRWRPLVDIMIAFNAMYFFASLIDGVLLARVESQLVFILMFSAMSTMFLQYTRSEEGEAEALEGEADLDEDDAAEADFADADEDYADVDYGYGHAP